MARPKKGSLEAPVRQRLEEEFWRALERKPISQITVSELVRATGCNRTTFYYHFESVEDLAWQIVSENMPRELPRIAQAILDGNISPEEVSAETIHEIERIGILIGREGSMHLAAKTEEAIKRLWMDRFEVSPDDEETGYVLEFLAGGIVSLIGRYGPTRDIAQIRRCMMALNRALSEPMLRFFAKG